MLIVEHVECAYSALRASQINYIEHTLAWLTKLVVTVHPDLEHVMTARAVRVDTVVAEHSLLGRLVDLMKELCWAAHANPSLTKALYLVVASTAYLDVALL